MLVNAEAIQFPLVFLEGILSFFSPCVIPLLPVYIGYLAGGASHRLEDGTTVYRRSTVMLHTMFFVLGISAVFFLLGFSFTALGQFFGAHRRAFTVVGGILILILGLFQLGVFRLPFLQGERKIHLDLRGKEMTPVTAFVMGFTFSFAWTPCVGPTLASVLLMATSAQAAQGFVLIGVYTLGFVLPFLAVGLFTSTLLELFRKHKNVVKYTVKIGGVLMVFMGVMMFTGWMNHLTNYLSSFGASESSTVSSAVEEETGEASSLPAESSPAESSSQAASEAEADPEAVPAPDFTLKDQLGNSHTLSDYQGKVVFLNFWGTWCPPCRAEMPDIQALYEEYGENQGDVVFLGVAHPNLGQEGTAEDVAAFMEENGYTYPTLMDEGGAVSTYSYYISGFPTTFMIDTDGNVYGYVTGQLTLDMMRSIIQQTIDGGA